MKPNRFRGYITTGIYVLLTLFTLLLSSIYGCLNREKNPNNISIKGSTTILPISSKIADEFMKNNNISVTISATGSGDGINALIEGTCDIAAASRAMETVEISRAYGKGIYLKEIHIAYDMIIPIVNPLNSLTNVTLNHIRNIFKGEITNWSELGLADKKIIVISRDSSSGTYSIWNKQIILNEYIYKNAIRVASNSAMIYTVASTPGSIGYVSAAYINNTVKPLSVDGIKPTIKNGMNGIYPISRKLYLIIDEKKTTQQVMSFIDFILSEKGQQIIKESEFLPL